MRAGIEVDDLDAKHDTTMGFGPEPGADKGDAPAEPPRAVAPVDADTVLRGAPYAAFLVFFAVVLPCLAYLCAQTALGKGSEQNSGMRFGWGVFAFGLLLMGVAATYALVGTVVFLLWQCALGKWQGIDEFWDRSYNRVRKPALCIALAGHGLNILSLVVLTGTWSCVQSGYFATEALGMGGEHVKGMYAVYALLSLGSVLGWLLFVCAVVGFTVTMASDYDGAIVTWAMVVLGGAVFVCGVVVLPPAFRLLAQAALDKDLGPADARAAWGFVGFYMFLAWVAAVYALVGTLVALLRQCASGKWQGIDDFLRRGNSHVWEVWGYITLVFVETMFVYASVVAALA